MSSHPPPQDTHWPDGAIFTVGPSTLPIERFIALLKAYGIGELADESEQPGQEAGQADEHRAGDRRGQGARSAEEISRFRPSDQKAGRPPCLFIGGRPYRRML